MAQGYVPPAEWLLHHNNVFAAIFIQNIFWFVVDTV
jgi:hypothetical protein